MGLGLLSRLQVFQALVTDAIVPATLPITLVAKGRIPKKPALIKQTVVSNKAQTPRLHGIVRPGDLGVKNCARSRQDSKPVVIGGASRARTDGLVVANDALSQLSYSPTWDGLFGFPF